MKKFRCIIVRDDGTEVAEVLEAQSRGALKKKLKAEGLAFKAIREEFSIKGSLTLFVALTFFIALPAAGFDVAYMSTLILILIGICWVLSLLTRNPRKAIFPAMITLAMVFWTMAISANLSRGMKKMIPEGEINVPGTNLCLAR